MGSYMLLLSYNPCDIFHYYSVKEMHGLNLKDCECYNNTTEDAYIAGWANFVPKKSGDYNIADERYVFINLSRCNNDTDAFALIMHELMHHSFWIHNYNLNQEEEIITWAELEAKKVYNIVKIKLNDKTDK